MRNANRAPVVPAIADQTVDKGQVLQLPVNVTDADGDPLDVTVTVTLKGLPQTVGSGGLPLRSDGRTPLFDFTTTGNGTGVLTVAPLDRDRGDYVVTITAADNGDGGGARDVLTTSRTFVVKSQAPSEPPLLAPIGTKVAVIGRPLQFTVRASDLDQDPLQFGVQNLPAGATFLPGVVYGTAVFTWTPTAADAGTRSVTFTVTDSAGGSDSRTIDVIARAANSAPVLLPVGNQTVAENALLDLQPAALDADGDVLTWSVTGLPPGAQLDPLTGRLTWQTNYFSAGTYTGVTLTVSDGAASSSESIKITVTQTNRAPIFSTLPPLFTAEQRLVQFTLTATDPDGDAVLYAPVGPLPQGAEFDVSNGRFVWTPSYDQAGDYVLGFSASDNAGASDTIQVHVSVFDVNRVPALSFTNHQVVVGDPLHFTIGGSDPDSGETLRFSARGLPDGATLDPVTGAFAWTPGAGQVGAYLATVGISDGKSIVERGLQLRVNAQPVGPVPAIVLTPSFPAIPGQPVAITVLADAFSAVAARTLTIDGVALALDANGRALFTAPATGVYHLVATATDLDGFTSTTTSTLRVRDPLDQSAPQVRFDPGVGGSRITGTIAIGGSIVDTQPRELDARDRAFRRHALRDAGTGLRPRDGDARHARPVALRTELLRAAPHRHGHRRPERRGDDRRRARPVGVHRPFRPHRHRFHGDRRRRDVGVHEELRLVQRVRHGQLRRGVDARLARPAPRHRRTRDRVGSLGRLQRAAHRLAGDRRHT